MLLCTNALPDLIILTDNVKNRGDPNRYNPREHISKDLPSRLFIYLLM